MCVQIFANQNNCLTSSIMQKIRKKLLEFSLPKFTQPKPKQFKSQSVRHTYKLQEVNTVQNRSSQQVLKLTL